MSDSTGPQPADYDYAAELFRDGLGAEAVEVKLVDRGLSPESAKEVVADLMIHFVRTEAAQMLRDGMLPQQVERQLRDRGLSPESAKAIVADAPGYGSQEGGYSEPAAAGGGNVVLMVLGAIVFVVGILLFIGNVSGAFPTFPCAGWLGIIIGGAIWGAGKKG